MWKDSSLLLDLRISCLRITELVAETTIEEFLSDWRRQDLVAWQFHRLGEAARRLSEEYRSEHAEVDWSGMIAMRNRMVHGYETIDWRRVWTSANSQVRDLLAWLETHAPDAKS